MSTAGAIASPPPGSSNARERYIASKTTQSSNWIRPLEVTCSESSSTMELDRSPHQRGDSHARCLVLDRRVLISESSFLSFVLTADINVVPSKKASSSAENRVGRGGIGKK